jgi:transposase-like protein
MDLEYCHHSCLYVRTAMCPKIPVEIARAIIALFGIFRVIFMPGGVLRPPSATFLQPKNLLQISPKLFSAHGQGGKTVREVAENLGVSQYSIYQWKKKFFPLVAMPGSMGKGSGSAGLPEDVEGLQKLVREQQRQIADLTQQREILKKTLGIVCEGPSSATNGSKK